DFNASTVSKSKPLEVRNLKPDSEAKDTQINLPSTTNVCLAYPTALLAMLEISYFSNKLSNNMLSCLSSSDNSNDIQGGN
ncbi:hypothetical protein U1Q18_023512, partial [Sarracenia purpurea var. burkii]